MLSATAEFEQRLAGIMVSAQISHDDIARYDIDGVLPEVAVEPSDYEQTCAALLEAREARLAVIPIGGGSHLALGNVPAEYDVALSTRRLNAIVAHEPADLTVTVQAGVQLEELQARLAEHGQFLPLDPAGDGSETIGGVVAANLSGPMRHSHGTARDWIIGIRVAHADGSLSKAGGRVVKNVAGFEMTKLYTGSLGTLGVIVEATFKLAPIAPRHATVAVMANSAPAACGLVLAARDSGLCCEAAEVLSPPAAQAIVGDARWCALLRLAGGSQAVERSLSDLQRLASSAHGSIKSVDSDAWPAWRRTFAPAILSLRANVLPSQVDEMIELLDRRFVGAAAMLCATPAAGVIRARLNPTRGPGAATLVGNAADAVARRGGTLVVESAPPSVKRQIDIFGPLRPDFAIMKRLKDEFDPNRTLAPGRYVGRL